MVQCPLDIVDCRIRHTAALEDLQPVLRGFGFGGLFDHAVDAVPVLYSVTVFDKTGVRFPLGEA